MVIREMSIEGSTMRCKIYEVAACECCFLELSGPVFINWLTFMPTLQNGTNHKFAVSTTHIINVPYV